MERKERLSKPCSFSKGRWGVVDHFLQILQIVVADKLFANFANCPLVFVVQVVKVVKVLQMVHAIQMVHVVQVVQAGVSGIPGPVHSQDESL